MFKKQMLYIFGQILMRNAWTNGSQFIKCPICRQGCESIDLFRGPGLESLQTNHDKLNFAKMHQTLKFNLEYGQ